MSHIVNVQTEIRDVEALGAATRRMQLPPPRYEEVQLFSSRATGYAVQLRDWRYPVVCDVESGQVAFDNFDGRWGKQEELDRLFQSYAIERTKLEARKQGHTVHEQALDDGSVKLSAVRAANEISDAATVGVLALTNMHRFLGSAEIVQAIARQVHLGKQNRTTLVILSPVVQLPPELEKLFVVLPHELPDSSQLEDIARSIATEESELPAADEMARVIESAAGLTRYEAENAFSLSLVRHGCLRADVVWNLKAQMLKKSGLVGLHSGHENFDQLGGLDTLKAFCLRAMRRQGSRDTKLRPRGVLLLSPPGCGKSQFAKSLGNETGRPTLTLDIGRLMGSLVGESEGNIRRALRITDAMAPCVLFCDELDKGLSGVGGNADSGVSSRLFGNFLTWLSDHESDVFVVATANDISKLPPEFSRAERFDSTFFVDLPNADQRQVIWQIYLEQFGLDHQRLPNDDLWTGAEIRACCRLAALLDVPLVQAANNIVPVAVTARESVERLREWANGRCLSADNTGVYHTSKSDGKSRVRRKLPRDPSVN